MPQEPPPFTIDTTTNNEPTRSTPSFKIGRTLIFILVMSGLWTGMVVAATMFLMIHPMIGTLMVQNVFIASVFVWIAGLFFLLVIALLTKTKMEIF